MEILFCSIICLSCFFAGAYVSGGLKLPERKIHSEKAEKIEIGRGKEHVRDLSDDIAEMLNYSLSARLKEKSNDKTDS